MKKSYLNKKAKLFLIGATMCFSCAYNYAAPKSMTFDEKMGEEIFEGKTKLENGGPSCITCHSVNNKEIPMGGLFAKDLTDVYSRLGEGISSWLSAPPFPAMASSYQNHPLTEKERNSLQSFFKHMNETKGDKVANKGYNIMLIGGFSGLITILILINIIWYKRKRKMVKQDIFNRQTRAWDAKY